MSDRELLEHAAKAAGIDAHITDWFSHVKDGDGDYLKPWNPLTDDGDALRLAVKLRISLMMRGISLSAFDQGETLHIEEWYGGDMATATRRAIVRAAATIGKKLDAPAELG